ncbi:MAG: iron ABC transporter permease [Deltaproteobacteria bacterium]|nr:iron ABC transporter permease [Deltaproteobacteria bacterium]
MAAPSEGKASRALVPVLAVALSGILLILIPLLATGWISFMIGVPGYGKYTLSNYTQVLFDPFGYRVFLNTLIFALGSTAMALIVAAPLAWSVARTDLPFRNTISFWLGMVLVIPGFLQGMGWALMLSPNIGILNRFLMELFGIEEAPFNIYSLGGMTFAQGLSLVPPAFFMLLPVFVGMDSSLEEAAFLSGAGKLRTFLRVNLPLAAPALVAAAIYVFVLAFALFEVPAVLGFPDRIFVFSTMLYFFVHIQQGTLPEYGLAAAYGSIVMIVSLLMATYYVKLIKQSRRFVTITGKGRRGRMVSLGKWRSPAFSVVAVYFILALVLPMLVLFYYSLLPFFKLPSLDAVSSFTFKNYVNVYTRQGALPLINTGILIAFVPVIVILVGTPISWLVVRSRLRGRFVIDNIAFLPLAVPRIVLSVSLLYLALVSRDFLPLYGTIFLIAIAHIIAFMSFATRTLNAAIIQIHTDLEDAGRVSGATVVRVLKRITAPLLKPALFAAWFWIMLLSFREVTMAVMLSSAESIVFPAQIWILLYARGILIHSICSLRRRCSL